MEKDNQGWVKFHRKSLKSSVMKSPTVWWVWSWCLMKASHQDHKFPFNGKDITIKKGQFITGRKKACKELKLTPQSYRTILLYLKNTSRITTQPTNKFTVVTVLNWDKYQLDNQQTNQPLTNQQPTTNQPLTTYKKDKNVKNDKNDNKPCVCFEKFWSIYPKKISKKKAEQCWNRMKPDNSLFEKISKAIETAKKTDQWERGFIPHPTTYLNQERWNDEFTKESFNSDILIIK